MKEKNRSLASEVIEEMLNEKNTILMEMECMDTDFEKTLFVLNNALESTGQMGIPETREESLIQHYNIRNINMQLSIAYDYVVKLQSTISDIVIREHKKNNKVQEEGGKDGLSEDDY